MRSVFTKLIGCWAAVLCVALSVAQSTAVTSEVGTSPSSAAQFTQRVLELTNEIRAKHGLRPLRMSAKLSEAATWMAEDMASYDYFDHTDRLNRKLGNRLQDFGYAYSLAGENIATGSLSPEKVVEGWMNSPGHRANILRAEFAEIGIGYSGNGRGYFRDYWVQNFAAPGK